jgi:hypothetical protein
VASPKGVDPSEDRLGSVNRYDPIDDCTAAPPAQGERTSLPSARPVDACDGARPSPDHVIEGRFVLLSPGPLSPQRARTSLRWLGGYLERDGLAIAFLVTSELVTNAVVHPTCAPDWIRVEGVILPACVRIEVSDAGPGYEPGPLRLPPPDALHGRGLWLMARLANRWGHDLPDASRIWFELDRAEHGHRS